TTAFLPRHSSSSASCATLPAPIRRPVNFIARPFTSSQATATRSANGPPFPSATAAPSTPASSANAPDATPNPPNRELLRHTTRSPRRRPARQGSRFTGGARRRFRLLEPHRRLRRQLLQGTAFGNPLPQLPCLRRRRCAHPGAPRPGRLQALLDRILLTGT